MFITINSLARHSFLVNALSLFFNVPKTETMDVQRISREWISMPKTCWSLWTSTGSPASGCPEDRHCGRTENLCPFVGQCGRPMDVYKMDVNV